MERARKKAYNKSMNIAIASFVPIRGMMKESGNPREERQYA